MTGVQTCALPILAPLAIHYKDYAVWLREKMQGEAYQAQEQYWLQAFEEEAPVLQLPTDYARPAVRRFEGDRTGQSWSEHETERLKQLCAKQGVTLYMALLAAYGVLLSRYAGQEDIVVGTPGICSRIRRSRKSADIFRSRPRQQPKKGLWRARSSLVRSNVGFSINVSHKAIIGIRR